MLHEIVPAACSLTAFPMTPTIGGSHLAVRKVYLARPDAPMKLSELMHPFTYVHLLGRRTQEEEGHGVDHVEELTHGEESRKLVRIRRLSKILKKNPFLCLLAEHGKRLAVILQRWRPLVPPSLLVGRGI